MSVRTYVSTYVTEGQLDSVPIFLYFDKITGYDQEYIIESMTYSFVECLQDIMFNLQHG